MCAGSQAWICRQIEVTIEHTVGLKYMLLLNVPCLFCFSYVLDGGLFTVKGPS